jgi:hypothetical protein
MAFKTSRLSGTNSNSKSKAKANTKYLMLPDVSRDAVYNRIVVFHDSKQPRPESYPPTSMSFSRATVPAEADNGVVVLSICTLSIRSLEMYGTSAPRYYQVFFLREALARLFQQQEQERPLEGGWKDQDQEEPYLVDWADWGPKTSRWFLAPYFFDQSRCSVHGYRFATLITRLGASFIISSKFTQADIDIYTGTNDPPPDTDADTILHLLVFDFNPYPLRRHQYSLGPPPIDNSPSSGNGNTVVIAPSNVTFGDWQGRFEAKVMGHLACRVTLMDEPADYEVLAACEDNIIGFQVRPSQHTHRERINNK